MDKPVILTSEKAITIGVVADTHIPDRVIGLHPKLVTGLKEQGVDIIFHCGDVSLAKVIQDFAEIAPVFAVRGNRDFFLRKELPKYLTLEINGVKIFLTHGHLSPKIYWTDKLVNLFRGYEPGRYVTRLSAAEPTAKLYIFGHTHRSENIWVEDRLFFNPGGCSAGSPPDYRLSFGVIRISPNGEIDSQIVPLTGAVVKYKKWDQGENTRSENQSIS